MKKEHLIFNQKGSITRIFLALVLFAGFFGMLIFAGYFYWQKKLDEFEATEQAKIFIQNHPQIDSRLGSLNKIKRDRLSGYFYYGKDKGSGQLSFDLEGEKKTGKIELKFVLDHSNKWLIREAWLRDDAEKIKLFTTYNLLDVALDDIDQKKEEAARENCRLLHQLAPHDFRSFLCFAALVQQDSKSYLSIYENMVQTYPNSNYFLQLLGDAYYKFDFYSKSLDAHQKEFQIIQEKGLKKEVGQVASNIAARYTDLKQLTKAKEWLVLADESGHNTALHLHRWGRYFYAQKKYKKAIDFFEKSRQKKPNYYYPYVGLAYSYEALGEHSNAIDYYERAINLRPYYARKLRWDLIFLLIEKDYLDEVVFHFIRMLYHHPNEIDAYIGLSITYKKQGRNHKAIDTLLLANKINPTKLSEKLKSIDTDLYNELKAAIARSR